MFSAPDSTTGLADLLRQAEAAVHLWRISLTDHAGNLRRLRSVLSRDERLRADRFATGPLSRRFVVCRAARRLILSEYVAIEGHRLQFRSSNTGKPCLAVEDRPAGIRFNVSHSEDLAVLAVSWQREVGVDIERLRPMSHLEQMVQRCLGPRERQAFHGDRTADRDELFLRYWTCKEAYVKAIGAGLRIPLASVEFDLRYDDRTPVLCRPRNGDHRASEVHLWRFQPDRGYCGALALVGSRPKTIEQWDWRSAA